MSQTDPLACAWYSEIGSRLDLTVNGSLLDGVFHSVDGPRGDFRVIGSVDPDSSQPDRALAFSVCWIDCDGSNEFRSVSSYTGQYHRTMDGDEFINTIFLLVDETGKQFASTFVGYDNFRKSPPSEEVVRMRRAQSRRR